jgi:RND family efflux transporter MFP subunit
MQARAADARVRAAADEAARLATMLDGGFVAPNEVEQKSAVSLAEAAQLLESKANVLKTSLDVRDCVLRAPFDGEIGTRSFDPGAFVHPGAAIVSVVDRDTMRVTVDASEKDFGALAPSTLVQIDILATGTHLSAPISRRAPRADPKTRTIHFEVDVPDPSRQYPAGSTAVVHVEVGKSVAATAVPIYAATQDEGKAKLFVVDHDVAHAKTLPVTGEVGGSVYFTLAALPAGSLVVTEGRALLSDGDKVLARVEADVPDSGAPEDDAGQGTRGGGYGRAL